MVDEAVTRREVAARLPFLGTAIVRDGPCLPIEAVDIGEVPFQTVVIPFFIEAQKWPREGVGHGPFFLAAKMGRVQNSAQAPKLRSIRSATGGFWPEGLINDGAAPPCSSDSGRPAAWCRL